MARPPLVPGKKRILAYSTASVIKHGAYLYKEEEEEKKTRRGPHCRAGGEDLCPVCENSKKRDDDAKNETSTDGKAKEDQDTTTTMPPCRHKSQREALFRVDPSGKSK